MTGAAALPEVYGVPGGDPLLGWITQRLSGTGVGTNAGVTVTIACPAGLVLFCTGIQVSGDGACLVTIESPANTVIWRARETGAFIRPWTFAPGMLSGPPSASMLVKISASTANCEANIQASSVNLDDLAVSDRARLQSRLYPFSP